MRARMISTHDVMNINLRVTTIQTPHSKCIAIAKLATAARLYDHASSIKKKTAVLSVCVCTVV